MASRVARRDGQTALVFRNRLVRAFRVGVLEPQHEGAAALLGWNSKDAMRYDGESDSRGGEIAIADQEQTKDTGD